MTDLISGETLDDIQVVGAVGGFSNSDVLGSAKGWAGAFKYNEKANQTLKRFFSRRHLICGYLQWMSIIYGAGFNQS